MPGFVDSTVKDIDNRLKELQDEVVKLEAARAALVGRAAAPAARPASRTRGRARAARTETPAPRRAAAAARKPGRPRGRRGGNTRSNQALELVRSQPGITIPQIAEALKIEPNYLYRVMPKLVDEGLVTREGQGWSPAASAAA
jgi:CRP-like cAMP-binding protein